MFVSFTFGFIGGTSLLLPPFFDIDAIVEAFQKARLIRLGLLMASIKVGQDIAITHNYEIGENIDKAGSRQKLSIRATNVFRKEGGQWKMIGHHTDLLPYLEKKN